MGYRRNPKTKKHLNTDVITTMYTFVFCAYQILESLCHAHLGVVLTSLKKCHKSFIWMIKTKKTKYFPSSSRIFILFKMSFLRNVFHSFGLKPGYYLVRVVLRITRLVPHRPTSSICCHFVNIFFFFYQFLIFFHCISVGSVPFVLPFSFS